VATITLAPPTPLPDDPVTIARLKRRLLAAEPRPEPRIVVTTSRGVAIVPIGEIEWIEASDNYARIWTLGRSDRSYLLRESLRQLEIRLRGHGFVRAHRRALVRLKSVRELKWTPQGQMLAVLTNGVNVSVSRRRRALFVAAIKSQSS
jgi:two-component system, LytTR family, response regulator